MSGKKYTIGIDYGSDSVRSVLIDTSNGSELASSVFYYPRWKEGKFCMPEKNRFRQHPLDYIEGLEYTVKSVVAAADKSVVENIVAISIDTTGSTIAPCDKNGIPLALLSGFEENPNAMFVLWKDHTAVQEAAEINHKAKNWGGIDYTKFEGGVYSSEWFWAKIIHVIREDSSVYNNAYSWIEHCDWIPALLTGTSRPEDIKRSRTAAGHKAMWHESWGGLPEEKFLISLEPKLEGLRNKLFTDTYTVEEKAGTITKEWAINLGVPETAVIGVGSFDAHLGAVGAEIKPYYLCKIMGTSTCDIVTVPNSDINNKLIEGICGQVDGSVEPGLMGLEAGQSAFGDVYAWFKNMMLEPSIQLIRHSEFLDDATKSKLVNELESKLIVKLSEEAEQISIEESDVLALDWLNGRRTPDANQALKGAIAGLSLGSSAAKIFRALVESTVFGSKAIIDRFIQQGVRIDGVIALGGVARKSGLVMQIMADVLNMPILVSASDQTCALGAAIAASVAGGIYDTFDEAKKAMGSGMEKEYRPISENVDAYASKYEKYLQLGQFVEHNLTK